MIGYWNEAIKVIIKICGFNIFTVVGKTDSFWRPSWILVAILDTRDEFWFSSMYKPYAFCFRTIMLCECLVYCVYLHFRKKLVFLWAAHLSARGVHIKGHKIVKLPDSNCYHAEIISRDVYLFINYSGNLPPPQVVTITLFSGVGLMHYNLFIMCRCSQCFFLFLHIDTCRLHVYFAANKCDMIEYLGYCSE